MLLSFNNVSTGYGKKEILHNVSFEMRSGEIVALAGSNGAGKSTILRTIFSFNEIILTSVLWYKTKFGRAVRAISSNSELSQINGIPKDRIITATFAFGSGIAGIVGILVGFDVGITPAMGFSVLLYGVAAMIIGGIESLSGVIAGALLLAIAQNIVAYYFDSKWTDTITYLFLITFLMVRPYGVSGAKNKKVEI